MKPFLAVDGQISLHLARHDLSEAFFAAVDENRAYLRPWLPWVDGVLSLADTKTFIQGCMQENSEGSRLTLFIMYEGQMAGSLGVVAFNKDHRKCEIGYWLRQDLQGRGILTKALAAFVGFLFKKRP